MSDLTTLAYVQAYMGDISAPTAAALPPLISAASAFIENYCSRTFTIASQTESYNGSGGTRLMLRRTPVISVTSVSILGQIVPPSSGVTAYGWIFDANGLWLRGGCFTKTVKGISVAYNAGLAASAAAMPNDLQECVAIMCNIRRKRVAQEDKISIGMDQQSTTFVTSELTPYVKQILSNYKPPFLAPP